MEVLLDGQRNGREPVGCSRRHFVTNGCIGTDLIQKMASRSSAGRALATLRCKLRVPEMHLARSG